MTDAMASGADRGQGRSRSHRIESKRPLVLEATRLNEPVSSIKACVARLDSDLRLQTAVCHLDGTKLALPMGPCITTTTRAIPHGNAPQYQRLALHHRLLRRQSPISRCCKILSRTSSPLRIRLP